jgi:hypothetical protein
MAIWGKFNCFLKEFDGLIQICNTSQMVESTEEGGAEIIEQGRFARMAVQDEFDGFLFNLD